MNRSAKPNKRTSRTRGKYGRVVGLCASTMFVFFLLAAAAIIAIPVWRGWQSYILIQTTEAQIRQISSLESSYVYRDEMLTMSLKMAAATGDPNWTNRYEQLGSREKPVIERSWNLPENNTVGADVVLTAFAENKLDEIEEDALEMIRLGSNNYAAAKLRSREYQDQKDTYNRGMKAFTSNVDKILNERYRTHFKRVQQALIAVCLILPLIVFIWLITHRTAKLLQGRIQTKHMNRTFGRQWQETFNAITDGVCIIEKDGGKILQCNKAMTRFLKKPYDEIIGHSCCELIHESSEPVKKCPFTRMLHSRRSEATEFQIGESWVNIKVEPLIDSNGNLTGAVHIISDITRHRQANRALRDSENKFRLAFANAQDAIVWIDSESGVIMNCNKAAEELFGKRKNELAGQHHTTLYPEDKTQAYDNLLTESHKGLNKNIEAEILTKSGHLREVTIAFSTMQVDDNEIIQGIIRDITDRKKAIEEIEHLARFPREDPNPVMRISKDGQILYSNDAGSPVLATWQIEEGGSLPEPWYTRIRDVYDSGDGETFELNCDDGHIFFLTLQPIAEAGYVNAYGLDITSHKKAEKEKTDLELQLGQKQKMEAIGTLAGGIAHDFNNILAAVQGYAELSLDDLESDNPVYENLEQILACSNRAKKLVKQILTFSRKDEQEQEKEPVQISVIIKEVLGMLRSSLPATIRICRKISAETSTVMADPTQIHQILVNLCTNSSHAMRETGGLLEVGLADVDLETETRIGDELLPQGRYVKLSVSDTGCGMEKEIVERIFEPFFTTKKVNEGTGLGLPVVHGIVKSHGGAITVSSTPGQGTTFEILLPRIDSGQTEEHQPSQPRCKDKEVILLVDDEEMMVDVTGQILQRLGFDVVAKTNSLDALETFQEKPDEFDLVITDLVMPNLTGTQLAEKIISIREDIPVILCSGFPDKIRPEEIQSIGIKEFIAKPIGKQEIGEIVRRVLDAQKTASQHVLS
ncbi:MAG: PAS domain S-box protein [Sedimentisphaerales bacterium]|nr:PAS domain S-box protein [Sedimentisphaerales bacterium]